MIEILQGKSASLSAVSDSFADDSVYTTPNRVFNNLTNKDEKEAYEPSWWDALQKEIQDRINGDEEIRGLIGDTGINEEDLWKILITPSDHLIDISHIPDIPVEKIIGLKDKLEELINKINVPNYWTKNSDSTLHPTDNEGVWSPNFISVRGKDPLAISGGSGGGSFDPDLMWTLLADGTDEKINKTHFPSFSIADITGLQGVLDDKISSEDFKTFKEDWLPEHYVTLDTKQVITGQKVFASKQYFSLNSASTKKASLQGDSNGNLSINGGTYSDTFISVRGSDPTAYSSSGINEATLWTLLGSAGDQIIHNSHFNLSISDIIGLRGELDNKATHEELGEITARIDYLVDDYLPNNYVTIATEQTITGHKTFTHRVDVSSIGFRKSDADIVEITRNDYGAIRFPKGAFSDEFISVRGADAEAYQSGGINEAELWNILGKAGSGLIHNSHFNVTIGNISGLQNELDNKATHTEVQQVDDKYQAIVDDLPNKFVTLNTDQTITGKKEFSKVITAPELNLKNNSKIAHIKADTSGDVAIDNGLYSNKYISVKGSDTKADSSSGISEAELWKILSGNTGSEIIDNSHINISIEDVNNLQNALNQKADNQALNAISDKVDQVDNKYGSIIEDLPNKYVTLSTEQTISGKKNFTKQIDTPSVGLTKNGKTTTVISRDDEGNVSIPKGLYAQDFLSVKGTDSSAASSGLNEQAMWAALSSDGSQKINVSHIPSIPQSLVEDLQSSLSDLQTEINAVSTGATQFKGVINCNAIPTSGNKNGDVYKIGTTGTSNSVVWHGSSSAATKSLKSGDVVIFVTKNTEKTAFAYDHWDLVPSGDDVEDTWRAILVNSNQIKNTAINSGSINFVGGAKMVADYSNNALSYAHSTITTTNTTKTTKTPSKGESITPVVTVTDGYGHLTSITIQPITLPNAIWTAIQSIEVTDTSTIDMTVTTNGTTRTIKADAIWATWES